MFRPVGDLPPSVYWRRRLILAGSVIAILVLLVLTASALTTSDSTPTAASSTSGGHRSSAPSPTPHPTPPATHSTSHSPSGAGSTSHSPHSSSSVPPSACTPSQLSLAAESDKQSYQVGDSPVLSILVKNTSPQPCVQDLADPQVVLRVYNGESRVWGSHDCKIEPGTNDRTLMPGSSVRVSIVWSGLSSRPNNCNNRQRAGAGTYTLYASLSGHEGRAAQFTIR